MFPCKYLFLQLQIQKRNLEPSFYFGHSIGGYIGAKLLTNPNEICVNQELKNELATYGITDYSNIIPKDIFSPDKLLTLKGFLQLVLGGFLVGVDTRYAGGCTSGHAISGLSNLQWPSLVATICFMIGGILVANFVLPLFFLLKQNQNTQKLRRMKNTDFEVNVNTRSKENLFKYLVGGVLFGIILTKAEVISWFRIQEMFRFQSFHMSWSHWFSSDHRYYLCFSNQKT